MADGNLLGGGVVVAIAAALWLVYLIPTWLRRREFEATERNAVRLQQTLRILAEAAEVPEEIRVEATARDVAETQKALRKVQQKAVLEAKERAAAAARAEAQLLAEKQAAAEAEARAAAHAEAEARAWAAAEARARLAATRGRVEAAERKARAVGAVLPATAAHGIRRGRIAASSALLVGIIAVVVGALMAWALAPLIVGAVLIVGALLVLWRLAKRVSDARAASRAVGRGRFVAGPVYDHAEYEFAGEQLTEVEVPASEPWTPQPLPRPLHLSKGTIAASTMASIAAAAELRRATERAELEERAERVAAERTSVISRLRPAKAAPEAPAVSATASAEGVAQTAGDIPAAPATPVATTSAPHVPDSRFARMGVISEDAATSLDLDAVLARRRAV